MPSHLEDCQGGRQGPGRKQMAHLRVSAGPLMEVLGRLGTSAVADAELSLSHL